MGQLRHHLAQDRGDVTAMKILIFTPVIKASAIGRMVCLVTHELAALGHHVVIVRTESKALRDLASEGDVRDFHCELVCWDDEHAVQAAAESADFVVYQIGDNHPFHEGCLKWLERLPGLVCLHDFYLGHLFHHWALDNMTAADAILRQCYGDEVANQFFKFPNNAAFIEGTREASPMTEWIASYSLGVITHSQWGTARVERACRGPVRVVSLAYDAPGSEQAKAVETARYGSRLNLLTIGYINRNKRVDQVIRAIASSPVLRENVVYRLVGRIESAMVLELSRLANSLRVNLLISGEVDDENLVDAFAAADVMSCLRWPSLEGSSASAVESMLYRKAMLVTNTGCYAEIPDECVLKIDHSNEVKNIRIALERLYGDSGLREELASRAGVWARKTFSAARYAQQLVEMGGQSYKARPLAHAAQYFESVLRAWKATESLLASERAKVSSSDCFENDVRPS